MITQISTYLTVGMVLDQAHQRGLRVDVDLASGRTLHGVTIAALERHSVVLLGAPDSPEPARAHVVDRDHVVGVSLDSRHLFELQP